MKHFQTHVIIVRDQVYKYKSNTFNYWLHFLIIMKTQMSFISQGKMILLSDLWICLVRIQIIQTCYLCPCLTLNLILIFTLFNRLPQRLWTAACLFLFNLFFFSQFFAAISKPCLRSLFLFMLYFLFSTFSLPLILKVCETCLYSYSTRVFVTLCGRFHNWML